MKVTFPTGRMISPGLTQIHTERFEEEEVWFMGHLIETKIHRIEEIHGITIPEPPVDDHAEFTFADRTWLVIRDDSPVWDRVITIRPTLHKTRLADGSEVVVLNTNPDDPANHIITVASGGKAGFMERLEVKCDAALQQGVAAGWWDIGPDGAPQRPAMKISIADMQEQNKPLMAHLMHDLGFFPSVGQARKNGWDKPLELGRHELGPKKKRAIVDIIP